MEQAQQGTTQSQSVVKPLDRFAVNIGEHLRAKGFNLTKLTQELTNQGYTSQTGYPLDITTVSRFLCENGIRKNESHIVTKGSEEAHQRMAAVRAARFPNLANAKPLDDKAFYEIAKPLREQGATMMEISQALNDAGYTKKGGAQICHATASHFLIKNGVRTYEPKARRGKVKYMPRATRQEPVVKETKTTDAGAEDIMLTIATSKQLTKQQKLQMMQALLV